MVENVVSVLGDVQIGEPISIIVTDGHTLAVCPTSNSGFRCHIGKSSVAIVTIKRIPQRRIRIEKIAVAAVHEIDVHPAVAIVIQKGTACPGSLRQVVLRRLACDVGPGDAANRGRHFFERIERIR